LASKPGLRQFCVVSHIQFPVSLANLA
jgi:hypothetical protein